MQYQLTIFANFGSVSPGNGSWYNAGTVAAMSATAPSAGAGEICLERHHRHLHAGHDAHR
ncbi:MAG: hypothetical protein WCK39_04960 [Methanomassiliicoccales archaeon]